MFLETLRYWENDHVVTRLGPRKVRRSFPVRRAWDFITEHSTIAVPYLLETRFNVLFDNDQVKFLGGETKPFWSVSVTHFPLCSLRDFYLVET